MFGFGKKTPPGDPIAAFWAEWPRLKERLGNDLLRPDDPKANRLTELVRAIHPELLWEMGKLNDSRELVITGEGILERRRFAERWKRAAVPTPGWTFSSSRKGSPYAASIVIETPDGKLAFADMRLLLQPSRSTGRVDIGLWHPLFPSLPEDARMQLSFLFLDHTVGEDSVMSWIGAIDALPSNPTAGGVGWTELPKLIQQVSDTHDESLMSLARGRHPDRGNLMIRFAPGLKPLRHIDHEWRVEVVLPITDSFEASQKAEDALVAALGKDFLYADHHVFIDENVIELHGYVSNRDAAISMLSAESKALSAKWRVDADPNWDYYRGMVGALSRTPEATA